LQRADAIAGAGDQLACGMRWASSDPHWWSLWNSSPFWNDTRPGRLEIITAAIPTGTAQ
jgi:hypothetical protein